MGEPNVTDALPTLPSPVRPSAATPLAPPTLPPTATAGGDASAPGAPDTPPAPLAGTAADAVHPTPTPRWKTRKKSVARRMVGAAVAVVVMVLLAVGAWFAYQALAPADDSPSVPVRDDPDTLIGRTDDLVETINEQGPDQELLDQVLDESDD